MKVEPTQQAELLAVARAAIMGRLGGARAAAPPACAEGPPLDAPGASFVTLTTHGRLRGCCGSIEPSRVLLDDVWLNAQRTAFEDPRFPPLGPEEAPGAMLDISVLGPLETLEVDSEQALIEVLRPGVDGLLMVYGNHRATFLPKVWRTLPEPVVFLAHLKRKMGVPVDFWDAALVLRRYDTQEFGGALAP